MKEYFWCMQKISNGFPPLNIFISYGPIHTSPMAHVASSTVVTTSFFTPQLKLARA